MTNQVTTGFSSTSGIQAGSRQGIASHTNSSSRKENSAFETEVSGGRGESQIIPALGNTWHHVSYTVVWLHCCFVILAHLNTRYSSSPQSHSKQKKVAREKEMQIEPMQKVLSANDRGRWWVLLDNGPPLDLWPSPGDLRAGVVFLDDLHIVLLLRSKIKRRKAHESYHSIKHHCVPSSPSSTAVCEQQADHGAARELPGDASDQVAPCPRCILPVCRAREWIGGSKIMMRCRG